MRPEPQPKATAIASPAEAGTAPTVVEEPPDPPPISKEVQDRAKSAPRRGFAFENALYLSTATGEAVYLTRAEQSQDEITDADAALGTSRDGKFLVFVRRVRNRAVQLGYDGDYERELWIANTSTGEQRRLLASTTGVGAEQNLTRFERPQFSLDGRSVFFETRAWETSNAVHVIDVKTLQERFIVPGECALVIPGGAHRGQLMLAARRHKEFPDEGFHAYEWWGVVDLRGKDVLTFPEEEAVCACCYWSSAEDREKINKLLGIPAAKATR